MIFMLFFLPTRPPLSLSLFSVKNVRHIVNENTVAVLWILVSVLSIVWPFIYSRCKKSLLPYTCWEEHIFFKYFLWCSWYSQTYNFFASFILFFLHPLIISYKNLWSTRGFYTQDKSSITINPQSSTLETIGQFTKSIFAQFSSSVFFHLLVLFVEVMLKMCPYINYVLKVVVVWYWHLLTAFFFLSLSLALFKIFTILQFCKTRLNATV